MEDFKKKYKTVMDDHFPPVLKISFGDQTLEVQEKVMGHPGFFRDDYRQRPSVRREPRTGGCAV